MKVNLIIAQYNVSYPGELMPNVMDAWDEFALEENFEGYEESLKRYEARVGLNYEWVRVLVVDIPDDVVENLNKPPVVVAKVVQ